MGVGAVRSSLCLFLGFVFSYFQDQLKFQYFRKSFYYQLWANGFLSLSNVEALSLLCFSYRSMLKETIFEYQKACLEYEIRTLATEEQLQLWLGSLMQNLKLSQRNLKQKIFLLQNCQKCCSPTCYHRIPTTKLNQCLFQRIFLNEIPIHDFYIKLQMQSNRSFHQKRRYILQNYTLNQVFQYLEIDQKLLGKYLVEKQKEGGQSCLSKLNKSRLIQSSSNLENRRELPYVEAVEILDRISFVASPLENIQVVCRFSTKLLECFEEICGGENPMLDMDNQLPLTIYCLIISKNLQLRPTICMLRDYFQQEQDYQSQNRTLAALKAAFDYVRLQWKLLEKSE